VGELTKAEVRAEAAALGLRTADKPDSQDVCFVTSAAGRRGFLGGRMPLHAGRVVDGAGRQVGTVPAVELVTVGQRKGLGLAGGGAARYAVDVDVPAATVRVGPADELLRDAVRLARVVWAAGPVAGPVAAQASAHGPARPATVVVDAGDATQAVVRFERPQRVVAPGQSVVLYDGDQVVGGGIAAADRL
jgi:tRNA-specific 2-thiouridylase